MSGTALLTLGRLPKALDIATALSSRGWRVIVAEPFGWHLCRVSRYVSKSHKLTAPNTDQNQYLDDLRAVISAENVSLVIPISEEALHVSLISDKLPNSVQMFSPGHQQLLELHDKYRFNRLAKQYGLPVPETFLADQSSGIQYARENDFVVKPVSTCSGQGFSAHSAGEKIPESASSRKSVVQQMMKGALKSTFSIAHSGKVIGTVVYRAAMLSGTVAVAFERLDGEHQIEDWISTFVQKSDYSGFISFDMMEDDDGIPHAIECNPRVTSGIHFVDRQDLFGAIIDPTNQTQVRFRPHRLMHQFFPSLTETQAALLKRDNFLEKLKTFTRAKDVNFAFSDPLPLWLMPLTSIEIMRRSFLAGESFGEASTFDIGWYE